MVSDEAVSKDKRKPEKIKDGCYAQQCEFVGGSETEMMIDKKMFDVVVGDVS